MNFTLIRGLTLALFVVVAIYAQTPSQGAERGSSDLLQVAVFYDGPAQALAEGYLDARHIENLLGHFGLRAEVIPLAEYRTGQLARYRAAFFVGTVSGTRFPEGFLADVRASKQPFCWIGRHIGALVNGAPFGFTYLDYRDDLEFGRVLYKGVTLPKDDPDLNIVAVSDPAAVQVLATAVNDQNVSHPYALRRGRFWYFADTPFSYTREGGRYLAFCDLLHDILEIDHAPQARALARIEDVSADIDPSELRRVADLLGARRVPFQIAVIPIFRNPAKGFEIHLSDRPALVEAIQYMVARGGTPVLHGVTHQYRGASGDDFEFWDEMTNRPVARDLAELVMRRLQLGLAECFANGIIPRAFETPHYAASETDYRTMQPVFTVFNERTMATPDVGSIQYFPYPVVDRFARYVVPENLGYLPLEDPDPKVIIEAARNLRVVRDAVGSFYFHPFLNPALLAQVVDGLQQAGYRFVSLPEFGGEVDYQGRYLVRASSRVARLQPQGEYTRLRVYDSGGRMLREQVSATRHTGAVEVSVAVPQGGWAALECLKEAPSSAQQDWKSRLRQWWARAGPARRPLSEATGFSAPRQAWILWLENAAAAEAHNQQSYRAALETFGYKVRAVREAEFTLAPREADTVLVIPQGAAGRLRPGQQQEIVRYLEAGGSVVADGRQGWLDQLGFRWMDRRVPVTAVADVLFPEIPLRWQPEEFVERFAPPAGAQPLAVDAASRQSLALAGRHGAGRWVYLAAPLDSHTSDATSHYPYFSEYLAETFRQRLPARATRLEAYFDPGFREGANLERLAAGWRQAGIRTIYVSAWHFYPRYSFDYDHFVRLCHRNGVAVYAWFIFPAVTPQMWEERPQWRERSAAGGVGRPGWRYAMNLENPACYRAAMEWMKELVHAHPWDGVNLSELNFDADFTDYLRADRFVPMNDDVRRDFAFRAGFDPAELFDPASRRHHRRNPEGLEKFLQYREDTVTAWHRRVLQELEPLRRERGLEVIVTMLDSLHSQYVRPALGVNSRRVAELMKEFDFTLQVEDPAEHWAREPGRYRRFAQTYRSLVPDQRRLMFDINVMPNRSVAGTSLPSATATGTELARTVTAAASASGRVAIYSEYTVAQQDWALAGAALAAASSIEANGPGWRLESATPLLLASSEDHDYHLDGRLWPAISPEGLLVPPGRRRISVDPPAFDFLDRERPAARLLHTSADLLDARLTPTGMVVRYSSPGRAVLVFNLKPLEALVDGRPLGEPSQRAAGNNWVVTAPRGEHQIELTTITQAGIVLNFWSRLSASTITAFGSVATVLMIAIYLYIRLRRLGRRGRAS